MTKMTVTPVLGLLMAWLVLVLGCSSAESEPAPELDSAWAEYQQILDHTRIRLQESGYYETDVLQAEAFRYLSGLIALQNQSHLHFGDVARPFFTRSVAIGNKWGFSNPDNLYLSAKVVGGVTYRVTGRLGSANQTTIGSYAGDTEDARAGKRFRGEDLKVGPNGEFELILGGEPQPGNWLPLDPEATSIAIYQIFADWDHEKKGEFRIEQVGQEGLAPPPHTPEDVARQLVATAKNVRHYVDSWLKISDKLSWTPANTLAPPREIQIASLGAWFVAGRYEVEDGEALVIEVQAPAEARYWGWTLYNPWSETLDYANRQTSLNFRQAHIDPDGHIRVVLSGEDPGVANWIDTAGHPDGFLAWRVTSEVGPDRPKGRVVDLAELRSELPETTRWVSPEERRDIIRRRQHHVASRYAD